MLLQVPFAQGLHPRLQPLEFAWLVGLGVYRFRRRLCHFDRLHRLLASDDHFCKRWSGSKSGGARERDEVRRSLVMCGLL